MVDKPRSVYTDRYGPTPSNVTPHSQDSSDYVDMETGEGDYWNEELQGPENNPSGEWNDLKSRGRGNAPQEADVDQDVEAWLGEHDKKTKDSQDIEGEGEEEGSTEYTEKKGVRYYDSKDPDKGKSYDFELSPTGERVTSVVETEGSVTINLPKDAEVEISNSGNTLIVKYEKETIKINLSKASGVHFVGGTVTGDVDNEDKKITTDQGPFISESEFSKLKELIDGIPAKIGSIEMAADQETASSDPAKGPGSFDPMKDTPFQGDFKVGVNVQDPASAKYVFGKKGGIILEADIADAKKQVDKVKEVFAAMSEALAEKDPKKRKELWEDATDLITDYVSQDKDGGRANNVAHMIGGILMDELGGKRELIEVFEKGLIPDSFANAIIDGLKANVMETTDMGDTEPWYSGGTLNTITHGTLANTYEKAAKAKSSSKEE